MSTSIPTAFRIVPPKGSDAWDVIFGLKAQAMENVSHLLLETCGFHRLPKTEAWKNLLAIQKRYKDQAQNAQRNRDDLSVWLRVFRWKKMWIVIPRTERMSILGTSLDFLETHPHCVDFWWTNAVDRPEEITSREWRRREKIWDSIITETPNNYTVLDVMSQDTLWHHFWKWDDP